MTAPLRTALPKQVQACNNTLVNSAYVDAQDDTRIATVPESIVNNFATLEQIKIVLRMDPSISYISSRGKDRLALRIHESARKIFVLCLSQGFPMFFLQWMMNQKQCNDESLPLAGFISVPRPLRGLRSSF
jgi:hypothetical protein